ncbi:hypothetical protein [Myxococcus landrumensis]|uniref:HEAT repeat domain-containing protein n=1 Tax=Myxococcus landrumensis TaxID=2813577 RepID=A0ABX7MYW1_9BACT|nr:hypothetical protein [Myxococcus landrumus]QSQ11622.1 hypothetical protein JY572_24875 [Myxococcus landrumus]
MAKTGPAKAEASRSLDLSRARALLDGVLVGLRDVKDPAVPLRAVERHLTASLGALYQALAATGGSDVFHRHAETARVRAEDALRSLRSARSKDAVVRRHISAVDEVVRGWRDAVIRTPLESLRLPRPDADFVPRAQGEVPTLVQLAREPLLPAIVLQWEEPPDMALPQVGASALELPEGKPVTLASLDALLAQAQQQARALAAPAKPSRKKRASASKSRPPVEQEEVERVQFGETLRREDVELARARSFFEDVAMMSLMRQPDAGDLWSDLRPVEDRLLARVDGILGCGTWVLPELVKLLDERPLPDPEMTWGVLFLHGCLAGDDALHQVERLLQTVGLEVPEVFDAAADALTFVPHPGTEGLLRRWLKEPGLARQFAVRALGRRGELEGRESLGLVWGDAPELVLEGARALPRARGELDLRETARLLRDEREEVVAAAIEALLLRRSASGLQHAHALLAEGRGAFANAALWTAVGGGVEARKDFEAALAGTSVSPVVVEALGWYGSLAFMDFLLARLRAGKKDAVGALQRLTGASLTDDEPAPEYEKGEEPFTGGFSPPPLELELTADAKVWTAWWEKHRGRASLSKRYRWGHQWSTQDNLWELEHAYASMRERRLAWHELVARTGATHPFDPRDFVARQQAAVTRWRESPEARHAAAGAWPLNLMR